MAAWLRQPPWLLVPPLHEPEHHPHAAVQPTRGLPEHDITIGHFKYDAGGLMGWAVITPSSGRHATSISLLPSGV